MGDLRAHAPLIWMDLEMTGLDPDAFHIVEIATVVTDGNLEVIAEGPNIVIHQPDTVLESMNPWCTEHHAASGLTAQVKASTISQTGAEERTLAFLRKHTQPGRSPLCGNSIGKDRSFVRRHMPRLDEFMAERLVDVTSFKELARRWYPDLKRPDKKDNHRALDDVLESIEELRFYRTHLFRRSDEP